MIKYLLMVVGVVGGLMWWTKQRRLQGPKASELPNGQGGTRSPAASAKPANMVSCAHCGLHLPESEALAGEQPALHFCSAAHRLAGPRSRR